MKCTNKCTFTEQQIASMFQIPLTTHSDVVTNWSCFTKYLLTEMVSVHLVKKKIKSALVSGHYCISGSLLVRSIMQLYLIYFSLKTGSKVSKSFSTLFSLLFLFLFAQLTMLRRELARWWPCTDAVIRTR